MFVWFSFSFFIVEYFVCFFDNLGKIYDFDSKLFLTLVQDTPGKDFLNRIPNLRTTLTFITLGIRLNTESVVDL